MKKSVKFSLKYVVYFFIIYQINESVYLRAAAENELETSADD